MKGLSVFPPFSTSKKNPTTAYELAFVKNVWTKCNSRSMNSPSMLCSEGAWKCNWRRLYSGRGSLPFKLSGKARYIPAPERVKALKRTFFFMSSVEKRPSSPMSK